MRAAKKISLDRKILQELVPLNALSPKRFKDISEKILVEEVKSGRYLFRKGDRDNQAIYLLEGKLNLIDGFRKVASEIESGTDMSRYPVSNTQPRTVSARAAKKSVIARIDSSLLDAFLTWDQANSAEAVEIGADENSDWLTRMLQSEAFIRIPPATIQNLLMKMDPIEVMAGDTIIRQGDEGDYFYTVREGRCAVSHRDEKDAGEQVLGEFSEGDSFGEESLVNNTKRNASVTMLTDGVLMRLAKEDFIALLQEPLVNRLDYETAASMVEEGAVWVDVRTTDEYEIVSFDDSVNIPLATLRGELSELVFNAKYVMCCDTGDRSASAAFLLSHRGFDVYVLDGGIAGLEIGILGQTGLPVMPPEADSEIAEDIVYEDESHVVVDIRPAVEEVSATNETARDEEPVTDTEEAAATAELEAVVEELSARNEMLEADLEQYCTTEARLTEQLELLRGELGESGEKLAGFYAQTSADNDEKRRLHEENASVQEQYAQQLKAMQSELDEARQQLAGLQSQVDAASEQRQQLLDEVAAGQQSSQAEALQLQEELAQARSRVESLENDLSAASETLPAEHAAVLQEQREQIAGLQEALEQAVREHEQQQNQLAASDDEKETSENSLRTELQERIALSDRLGIELTELQQQFLEAEENLAAATARSEELETGNAGLADRVESLQQELDGSCQQIEQLTAAAEEDRQALERRIEELGSERMSAVSEDQEAAAARIQSLEQEIENLHVARSEADAQLQEHAGHVESLTAGRQAAEEALEHRQADWDAERAQHNEETEALRQAIEELRSEQGAVQEQFAADKAALEEQLRSEKGTQQEQYEARLLELQEDQAGQAGELQEMQAERDNWEQKFNAQIDENNQLQQDVARLNEQIATHSESADEQLQALQSGLDTGQQRITELEQTVDENNTRLAALQEELTGKEASIREEGQQQELLRQQLDELRQELAVRDERARQVEQENEESIRKAHEDLTRKNDNEKELQGQIVRLRKKLEQATLEQQQVRESAQTDIDNIREELHAERQSRAEERAELAARQRELKEQLVAVASEHETNLNNQSGAIEEARDAAREEERMHLEGLIKTQQQTEEQLQKMQDELQQAHAEIARLHQQEKDRRQAGTELQQEQNSQAEAAISQLESQLKQLTQERDQSLEEQLALREKLNVLRGEVEVARGLMNVGQEGQVEDPARLRSELEETRKNVEISVRLRAEAEAARDQLIRERDTLRELLESREDVELPVHVPSLDEGMAGEIHVSAPQADVPLIDFDMADVAAGEISAGTSWVETSRKRTLLGSLVVVMIGISALILWMTLGMEGPLQPADSGMDATGDKTAVQDEKSAAENVSPGPIDETPPASDILPAPGVAGSTPQSAQVVAVPATPVVPAAPGRTIRNSDVPEPAAAAAPTLTAGPVFRDKLKNGRKGPLMVELPGGSYMMGSPGNSLNFDEGPRHQVTLTGFSISKHEVSFAEYDRFARATGRRLPHDEGWGRKDRPVINVSWHAASAYAAWLSEQTGKTYRLPTESEWEYAIRAGGTDQRWWGSGSDGVPANCFNCGSQWDGYRTAPVGSFAANIFGLHDMAGNVQEWVQDCYRAGYAGAPVDGSARLTPECTQRVVRGGAYTSPQDTLRSAKRGQYDQDTRLDNLGFRVVRKH